MGVEKKAVEMRQQPANERIKNFDEVPLGYNEDEALREASRCLQCVKNPVWWVVPCMSISPVSSRR